MNKVILMGRLTKDPEIRYSQGAEPLCIARYTLAVNRRFKREGEQEADFIPCVAFRKNAEFAERFLKKGMQILVSGVLQIRAYDDPQTNQRRWMTDVVVDEQEFTESKAAYESRMQGSSGQQEAYQGHNQSFERAQPPAQRYESAPKAPSDMPSDFFIDQELNDEDLPF